MPDGLTQINADGLVMVDENGMEILAAPGAACCCGDCCVSPCGHWLQMTIVETGYRRFYHPEDYETTLYTQDIDYTTTVLMIGTVCDEVAQGGFTWLDGMYESVLVKATVDGETTYKPEAHYRIDHNIDTDLGPVGWYANDGDFDTGYIYPELLVTDEQCLDGTVIFVPAETDPDPSTEGSDEDGPIFSQSYFSTTTTYTAIACPAGIDELGAYIDPETSVGAVPNFGRYCDEICHGCWRCPAGPSSVLLSMTVDGTAYNITLAKAGGKYDLCGYSAFATIEGVYMLINVGATLGEEMFRLKAIAVSGSAATLNYEKSCSSPITAAPDTHMLGSYTVAGSTAFQLAHTITGVTVS